MEHPDLTLHVVAEVQTNVEEPTRSDHPVGEDLRLLPVEVVVGPNLDEHGVERFRGVRVAPSRRQKRYVGPVAELLTEYGGHGAQSLVERQYRLLLRLQPEPHCLVPLLAGEEVLTGLGLFDEV